MKFFFLSLNVLVDRKLKLTRQERKKRKKGKKTTRSGLEHENDREGEEKKRKKKEKREKRKSWSDGWIGRAVEEEGPLDKSTSIRGWTEEI